MMEGLKDKVIGPLVMLIIGSLSAGTWAIVLTTINNQGESERHDKLIEGLAFDMKKILEVQTEIKIEISNNRTRDSFLRRDVDKLTLGFDNAHK